MYTHTYKQTFLDIGQCFSHPHDMGGILLQAWRKLWTQEDGYEQVEKRCLHMKELIRKMRDHNSLEAITVEDVKRGIKLMNSGTAVGTDQWSPHHWKQISPEAKEAIAHVLNHVEKHRVWPGHLYYNIIVLMGKPAGRSRPISLMPMLYRLWTKIRRPYIYI